MEPDLSHILDILGFYYRMPSVLTIDSEIQGLFHKNMTFLINFHKDVVGFYAFFSELLIRFSEGYKNTIGVVFDQFRV